jgi:vitamin B12/bleomycin/antimicrobial peptide transport system ATP-binding/permease protein
MIDRPEQIESAAATEAARETAESRLAPQLAGMLRSLRNSRVGHKIVLLCVGIFVIVAATAYAQVRLTSWNKPFYDALSRRDFADFLVELGVFFVIAGSLLVLNVAQRWLGETLKVKLRDGLARDLIHDWMAPRRAFWLANAGSIGVNPDQRMHEDTRHLCELSVDLGIELLQASILFLTFAGYLWVLSRSFAFHFGGHTYPIPGFMVWAAILYAGVGSLLSYWVGKNLIHRNAERYAREAELRFSLVRVNEHLDGISLASGEADEERRVNLDLTEVLAATTRLVTGLTNLTWVTAGFGWVTQVVPILVATPLYFSGKISLGGLMMAAAAFLQAVSSLRWFVDNFSTIADWRATLIRVATFHRAVLETDEIAKHVDSRITYLDGDPGRIVIENLEVVSSSERGVLKERHVELRAGERLLILCESGTGKTQLFRALAGLWPWGAGTITRPRGEAVQYLPRGTPYMPRGTLREVLGYPQQAAAFSEMDCARALTRFGLGRLAPLLGETRRWDRDLTADEQLCLAFSRLVLQAPPWIVIDDTFGSLDGDTLKRVIDVFANELEHSSVIHIGTSQARDPLFSRVVHLVRAPEGRRHARADKREGTRRAAPVRD